MPHVARVPNVWTPKRPTGIRFDKLPLGKKVKRDNNTLARGTLKRETVIIINKQKVRLAEGTIIDFNKDGKITGLFLKENTQINGLVLSAGKGVDFYSDGTIRRGVLAEEATIGNNTYKKGSTITFSPEGKVAIANATDGSSIEGYTLSTTVHIWFNRSTGKSEIPEIARFREQARAGAKKAKAA